jgi:hypothetical protein
LNRCFAPTGLRVDSTCRADEARGSSPQEPEDVEVKTLLFAGLGWALAAPALTDKFICLDLKDHAAQKSPPNL